MFKNLKQKSFRKQTERNLKNRDFSTRNTPLKTLGFLIDEEKFQDFEALYDFSETLGIQRKDVKLFCFVEYQKKAPSLRQNQINNKDFSWKGEITNQNAKEFLEIPFDVLIGFYKDKNEFLDLMASSSSAKFKVGVAGVDDRLYDLILSVNPYNVASFKNELKKYLRVLNKI
jgi:hypothetical protein